MANILVVDDEMGIRELLSEILGDEGHVVATAENAQQARECRAGGAPDLVLLDIWMPDTDGVTLLKEWQRDGLLTMPVIMMSGHATIDTAVEATRIGALNFLEKPIALQKLLKAVQQGLTRSQEPARTQAYHVHARPVASVPAAGVVPMANNDANAAQASAYPAAPIAAGTQPRTIAPTTNTHTSTAYSCCCVLSPANKTNKKENPNHKKKKHTNKQAKNHQSRSAA